MKLLRRRLLSPCLQACLQKIPQFHLNAAVFTEAYAPSYYDPRPVAAEAAYYPPPARVEEQRPPSPPPRAIYDPRPPPQEDYYPAPQKVLPSSIYRPTPLVAQLKADRERAGYSVPQYDERRPNPADVYDALYRQDSANDGGDYRNGGGDGPVHQKLANTPAYVPLYAPIPERISKYLKDAVRLLWTVQLFH